jgi:hypothetical protein
MEWFRKADGELVVGEIACRSGGGHLVDMMNWANDFSIHREWANAVVNGRYEGRPARAYNVAMVFKRAHGQGRITAHWGLGELKARLGGALVRDGLLPLGAPRRDWRQTLVSDGYLAVRHADREACLDMMDDIIRNLRVEAG